MRTLMCSISDFLLHGVSQLTIFLELQEDESAAQFANRVKTEIARQGGLVDLIWYVFVRTQTTLFMKIFSPALKSYRIFPVFQRYIISQVLKLLNSNQRAGQRRGTTVSRLSADCRLTRRPPVALSCRYTKPINPAVVH